MHVMPMKKFFIPIVIAIILFAVFSCLGGRSKITLSFSPIQDFPNLPSNIQLNVYVENSGSMDGYMCAGSNLKDAVYDYVSDLSKYASSTNLFYVNSQIIKCNQPLNAYIQNLSPASFAASGGNRSNTDLRLMIDLILKSQRTNTVSVFVSDCILDIPENAINFFGNCQVSIKNSFNEALKKDKNLGVQILKMQSKFEGYWYCSQNKELLHNVKRPYYIWVIGNKYALANLNKNVPYKDILGGIDNYCAFSPSEEIPFDIEKKRYVVNHTGNVKVEILTNLSYSLQSENVIRSIENYSASIPKEVNVVSVIPITKNDSKYSHIINVELLNAKTLKSASVVFSYPSLPSWVKASNDDSGTNVKKNIDKTTGVLYLIKGVADAYKGQSTYGSINFNIRNK